MITISQTVLNPTLNVSATDSIRLRGWYTNSFVAGDGVTSVQSGNGQSGFYYDIECQLNDDGNVVIPAFAVQETTLSNPTAGFFGQLFVNDAPGQMIFGVPQATAGWQIPTIYGAVVSFDQLARYNAAVQLLYASAAFFTQDQTIAEIERIAGEQSYAGFEILGRTELSTAPADPSRPVALSATDTNVGDLHGSLTTTTVPRASAAKTLVNGLATDDGVDFSIQTLNYVQLGDFNVESGGTKFAINDTFALVQLLAARTAGAEYAGVVADASSGDPTIEVQATDYSYLKNTAKGIVALGDGAATNNSTRVIIDDVARLIKLTNVPIVDPAIEGAVWSDGGVLTLSAG